MKLKLVPSRKMLENQQQTKSKNTAIDQLNDFELQSIGDSGECYTNILASFSKKFNGHLVTLLRHDFSSGHGKILYQYPSNSSFSKGYQNEVTRNPWFLSTKEYIKDRVLLSQNLLASNELQKTDFYQNLLEPHRIFYAMHSVLFRCGDRVYLVSIYRSKAQGCFTEADKIKIKPFAQIFSKKLLKDLDYAQTSHLNIALKKVLNKEKHLVLLMNHDGRIIYCNKDANFLCSKEINIKNGMLLKNSTVISTSLFNALSTSLFNALNSNLEKSTADLMKSVELVLPTLRSKEWLTLSLFPVGKIY